MFSAVYLVCMLNQPCRFFVDPMPYPTIEVCQKEAQAIIDGNQARVVTGEVSPHTAEYQCITWNKA